MSHHIVSIDTPKCKVYVQKGQLFVATEASINSIPLEDVASIVITSFKCDIAHSVFVYAAKLKMHSCPLQTSPQKCLCSLSKLLCWLGLSLPICEAWGLEASECPKSPVHKAV